MSRIGKIPVSVPKEVKVAIAPDKINLEGPKGKLSLTIPANIKIEFKDQFLKVTRSNDEKQSLTNHGTIRAHLVNMIDGVTKGHKKELEIQGIGFRAATTGKNVTFNLGFSHPIEFPIPADLKVTITNQTLIAIEGPDIQRVGEAAAKMKALKPVEPYKGKGIRYVGQFVRRKQGKAVTK